MTRPIWQPGKELTAAIEKAVKDIQSFSTSAQLKQVQRAIHEAAEQQRRLFANFQQMATAVQPPMKATIELFDDMRKRMKAALPANLWNVGKLDALGDIVENEGIPLAHVPRGELVRELIAAADYQARRSILASRTQEVVEDCSLVLADPLTDPDEDAIRKVALKAVEALGAGHPEAAQSLAVLASEQFISESLGGYNDAKAAVEDFIIDNDTWFVAYYNALLPLFIVPTLYAAWRPTDGTPPPNALSRHVTVHQVTADHLNEVNAVIAVLQVSGLVCAARWMQKQRAAQ